MLHSLGKDMYLGRKELVRVEVFRGKDDMIKLSRI